MMNSTFIFRPAKFDDIQTIKDIARRVIISNYALFLEAEVIRDFINSGQSDKEIDNGMENCILMAINGQTIGFSITRDSLLHLIMIDTTFQGKEHGSKLLAYTEDILFDRYETIHLQSFKENTQAIGFYLKNGWKVVEENAVPEIDKTMVLFEKSK